MDNVKIRKKKIPSLEDSLQILNIFKKSMESS